jgi:glycosyltransferase involved in cell wall biosynthesis
MHVVDDFFQGSRTHVLQLFAHVIKQSPGIDFYLFLNQPDQLFNYSSNYLLPNVYPIRMPAIHKVSRLCCQLPALQLKYRLDLIHMQNVLPMPSLTPCLVTIHDLLFESHPQFFSPLFRFRSRLLMRSAAARSAHVFTVSNYSKQEIISRYGVAPDKVTVLYNGVDTSRFYPGADGREQVEALGLVPGNYLLTVGRLDVRKNHVTLLEAYARLPRHAPELVIAGQRDYRFEQVNQTVERLNLQGRVRIMEQAGDQLLPALYRHARLFVYPSWAEGFGMPPLEAMASGVPVITSQSTALPEIVGNKGVLVNPGSVAELSAAMTLLLENSCLVDEQKNYGLERVASFRWEESARAVSSIYSGYFDGIRTEVRNYVME